jgi:dimeric dUTPase (all-alpha-NTP-PPase superfamily)
LFSIVSKFDEDAKSKKMAKLISKFYSKILELGYSLGFKFSEIKEAYQKKSEINHERQKNNY